MKRHYVVRGMAVGLLLVMMAALVSCSSGQQSVQQVGPNGAATPKSAATPKGLGMMFPGLEGIPPDQLFEHFQGGQVNMTDKNGTAFIIKMTPGVVNTVTGNSIAITPNGQTAAVSYNITRDTIVQARPDRGSIEAIVEGDKVVVLTRDNSMDAVMIAKHGAAYHMQMMESMMAP